MYAHAHFRLPDGTTAELGHGDIIGRLWSAALWLDDPRVSEAHAMVSLRNGELRLLALRGRFTVGRRLVADARLFPGLRIGITSDLELEVVALTLPQDVLAIEGDGLQAQALPGNCALVLRPEPALVAPVPEDPEVAFWSTGGGWRMRPRGGSARQLLAGDTWTCGARSFRAVPMRVGTTGDGVTVVEGGLERPLRIVVNYDTVHLHFDAEPVILGGVRARLLSELVAFDGPVAWTTLARELWGSGVDEASLRRRLDVCVSRLRSRLREAHVRQDLVRATGTGQYELVLHPQDVVEDRT